ncbi:MAG: XdhC family protein [Chloroflexaceae bacterium]|jgi:xanthine dehydrogenase accessory factor|nr:XdhC family protein [Chloroflexaceae bacterium]
MYDDYFAKAHELTLAGVPFATALVVRAETPTSGKPGDKAIITADGTMYGWIGGSCAQPTVVREAQRALRDDASRFIRLSPDPSQQPPRAGLVDVAMSCFSGGTLEIYIEPQQPRPRLLVVGGLPVARALAVLGQAMNYHVLLADPDHMGEPPPYASQVIADLTTLTAQINLHTAVVVASHGQYDELALEQVLSSSAFYIGLIASQRRAGAVRRHLEQQGLSAEQLRRFKAPAGLNIGARRGDEIALSVMAEIVQRRRQALEGTATGDSMLLELGPARPSASCPVCHMVVDVASAKYQLEYEGTTYYFCCPGCRYSFRENPAAFVPIAKEGII